MFGNTRFVFTALALLVSLVVFNAGNDSFADTKATVAISGNATLDGETDHSGITVLFTADSPSAVTTSTATDAAGDYTTDVEQGVYDVTFSKTGFLPDELLNQYLLSPTILASVTLAPESMTLSGDLSGTLSGPATYYVDGHIAVAEGDTLIIEPGARFEFLGSHAFNVSGLLLAQGTEADSVVFTSGLIAPAANDWDGIKVLAAADDNTVFDYCSISYADIGLFPNGSAPTISHCAIRDADWGLRWQCPGGAAPTVYVTISDCVIERCASYGFNTGGGELAADILRCTIRNCATGLELYGDPARDAGSVVDCVFEDNTGSSGIGIQCQDYFSGEITGCTFTGNVRSLYIKDRNFPIVSRCLFYDNELGIYIRDADPVIEHCTLTNNSPTGISFGHAGAEAVVNSNIIEGSVWPVGMSATNSANSQLFFNCIDGGNPIYLPPNVGTLVFENANGDSCDVYYNIFMDPELIDPGMGDLSLSETSPCIDAGDLMSPLDPDGTIADMGAIHFNQVEASAPLPPATRTLLVEQNAPNPFNPMTTIGYTLTRDARVDLRVFDVAGRLVRVLMAGRPQSAGTYRETWDGRNGGGRAVSSGVYFYNVSAGPDSETRRMTLVR